MMLLEIFRHTPPWVWLLLAALVALGASQLRPRRLHPARLWALPLVLLGLGLVGTVSMVAALPLAGLAWGLALAGAFALARGRPAPAGARWDAEHGRIELPGSVVPLLLVLAVFSLRYSANVGLALHPAWRGAPEVALPLAAVYGAIGGWLLARNWVLWSLTRRRDNARA